MNIRLAAVAVAAVVGVVAHAAAKAQDAPAVPERPKAEVMVLGVFHFASSNDVVNAAKSDVMNDRFQAELDAIADALAEFQPTKVMLEATPDRQAEFDDLYAAYRAGDHELTSNERQQIGFRLAAKADLETVHAVDFRNDFDFPGLMEAMQAAGQTELDAYIQARMAALQARFDNPAEAERSIAERLREHNDPNDMLAEHAVYMDLAEAGDAENAKGAEVVGAWWTRNMHIYANVARAAEDGDRIVVIFGSGHAPTLRWFFEHADRFTLVEPNPFLETVAP